MSNNRTRGDTPDKIPSALQCRRSGMERRSNRERRFDPRLETGGKRRSLKAWVRTFTNPRLGVDRRKGGDRRQLGVESKIQPQSLNTFEKKSPN